jgi:hypothetical protein
LTEHGALDIAIGKPNHFDMSGFFQMDNGQMWWFRIEDLRWSKNNMLVRTAQSFKDYTGGRNQYVSLCFGEDTFKREFLQIIS